MRLLILTTGGTIDSAPYPDTGPAPEHSTPTEDHRAEQVLKDIVLGEATLESIRLTNKDSKLLVTQDFDALEHAVIANQDKFDRILVTIGTDRMTDAAQDLEARLIDPPDVPVVFTGAIWPLANAAKTDGRDNLRLAAFGEPYALPGVYIAMHGLFLPCRDIRKDFELKRFVRA